MFHIKRNLPAWERIVRIVAGLGVSWAIYSGWSSNVTVIALGIAAGATMILTAFVGFCPACWMVGRRFVDE